MSQIFAITTLIELIIECLLVYGFMYEEKVIVFEQNVKRIVVGNIRRIIRISRQKREVKTMRKILIKIAYRILQHYCIEDLPYIYCENSEYKVISAEINPIQGCVKIYAERKQK